MTDQGGVWIRWAGSEEWTVPESTAYTNEAHLQEVLAKAPDRIPGVTADALTVRELHTSGGYVDVCAVDADGRLTVVECKLASNSERRRMVVGQVIDYAAAIWRDGEERFMKAWVDVGGPPLEERLSSEALDRLRRDLRGGVLSLCLAVDRIDEELQRLIEYLNLITVGQVSVSAVQLAYARDRDVEILIPTTFGTEIAQAKLSPAARTETWTVESFVVAPASDADRETARWLIDRTCEAPRVGEHGPLWFGKRPTGGVFLYPGGRDYSPAQVWVNGKGELLTSGAWNVYPGIKGHDGFAELAAFLGQDHHGPSRSVPVAPLDRERLWDLIVQTAIAINTPLSSQTN